MHRLIHTRYSESGTVLEEIADNDKMLEQLVRLDGATNDRIQGEQSGLSGISPYELVYGIPNDSHHPCRVFTHQRDRRAASTMARVEPGMPAIGWKHRSMK